MRWWQDLEAFGREPPLPPYLDGTSAATGARHFHQRLWVEAKLPGLLAGVEQPARAISEVRTQIRRELPLHGIVGLRERLEKHGEEGIARPCAHFPARLLMRAAPGRSHASAPVIGNRLR